MVEDHCAVAEGACLSPKTVSQRLAERKRYDRARS